MKVRVVGLQSVDFYAEGDNHIQGIKVHYVTSPSSRLSASVTGSVVDTMFVRSSSDVYSSVEALKPDKCYDFVFDYDGKRAVLVDVVPTA